MFHHLHIHSHRVMHTLFYMHTNCYNLFVQGCDVWEETVVLELLNSCVHMLAHEYIVIMTLCMNCAYVLGHVRFSLQPTHRIFTLAVMQLTWHLPHTYVLDGYHITCCVFASYVCNRLVTFLAFDIVLVILQPRSSPRGRWFRNFADNLGGNQNCVDHDATNMGMTQNINHYKPYYSTVNSMVFRQPLQLSTDLVVRLYTTVTFMHSA